MKSSFNVSFFYLFVAVISDVKYILKVYFSQVLFPFVYDADASIKTAAVRPWPTQARFCSWGLVVMFTVQI